MTAIERHGWPLVAICPDVEPARRETVGMLAFPGLSLRLTWSGHRPFFTAR
jgi:hypothetical protein